MYGAKNVLLRFLLLFRTSKDRESDYSVESVTIVKLWQRCGTSSNVEKASLSIIIIFLLPGGFEIVCAKFTLSTVGVEMYGHSMQKHRTINKFWGFRAIIVGAQSYANSKPGREQLLG